MANVSRKWKSLVSVSCPLTFSLLQVVKLLESDWVIEPSIIAFPKFLFGCRFKLPDWLGGFEFEELLSEMKWVSCN